ncbi:MULTISPECIES: hypothetical protein [unclassified Pseudomonas]|jgi:hypothetical protein|uniref:hypothetical protein n=1 Tax=unclassified Pseudomonas TaxID=196821 RepID=UPI002FE18418
MSSAALSYRGPADLTLTYGAAPGLGRSAERPGVDVVVSRPSADAPVSVLPDGTVLAGAVQGIAESGDYFETAAVSQSTQGNRYA